MTEAYVTLSMNDHYAFDALVLADSLRRVNTQKELCVLISPCVSDPIRVKLANLYDYVVCVDVLDSNNSAYFSQLKPPELGVTFAKLNCWNLTKYSKCVFLDTNMLALKNSDELFKEAEFSSCCYTSWTDYFNSGLFVFAPSRYTYAKLLLHIGTKDIYDGCDQVLLNTFFKSWNRLSCIYNVSTSTNLSNYKINLKKVKFVHLEATKLCNESYQNESHPGKKLNDWWMKYSAEVCPTTVLCSTSIEEPCPEAPLTKVREQFDAISLKSVLDGSTASTNCEENRSRWDEGIADSSLESLTESSPSQNRRRWDEGIQDSSLDNTNESCSSEENKRRCVEAIPDSLLNLTNESCSSEENKRRCVEAIPDSLLDLTNESCSSDENRRRCVEGKPKS